MKTIVRIAACAAALMLASTAAFAQRHPEKVYFSYQNPMSKDLGRKGNDVHAELLGQYWFGFTTPTPSSGSLGLDVDTWRSFSFGMSLASVSARVQGNVYFNAAVRWSFENYVNAKNYEYYDLDGHICADPLVGAGNVRKSKMRADYLGIPVGFSVKADDLMVYANISAEVLTAARSKVKADNNVLKDDIGGLSMFRSCVEAGISYGCLGVFARYTLTSMYTDISGVQYRPVTFGLTLGF